jgi:nitrate/nitrite-specific signal transduction histidine kinase
VAKYKIKRTFIGLSAVAVLSISSLADDIKSMKNAVDMAGQQRMFTQRMLKDYAMVGMNNTFGKPDEDLKKTVGSFETNLELLMQYTKDENTKKSLEEVKKLWEPIKSVLNNAPEKDKVEALQKDMETLLKAADEATKAFAQESGHESGEIINIAGRQRMLSQRMASLYMLKVWGVEDPEFKTTLDETMNLFKTSHEKLEKSDINTPETIVLLGKVKRSFIFFEMMNRGKSTKFIPTLIYKKSNEILKDMNSVTGLYVTHDAK